MIVYSITIKKKEKKRAKGKILLENCPIKIADDTLDLLKFDHGEVEF